MPEVQCLVAAFPNFVRYVVVGFALAALFLWIYVLITPWREFALIRVGNSAAETALVGALLGFSLPLANTIAHVARYQARADGRGRRGFALLVFAWNRGGTGSPALSLVSYKPFLSWADDLSAHRHAGLLGDDTGRQQSHVRPEPARRLRRNRLARRLAGFELSHAP
jgi:hypothetical protein